MTDETKPESTPTFGQQEGETCWRNGCQGVIELLPHKLDGCSCHISPPCSYCTEILEYCPECGWEAEEDKRAIRAGEHAIIFHPDGFVTWPKDRPLDPRKIDYRIKPHSNSSQLCEGVYPEGTTSDEVRARVNGTFGGKFEQFGGGKFRFIAYTD